MLLENGKYYFLGRPRRFGKSLFLSTLQAFFEGKRDLFNNLKINQWDEWNWNKFPVIHIDLNAKDYTHKNSLVERINMQLIDLEHEYEITPIDQSIEGRFLYLIKSLYEKSGEKVVVLIDEYDKPILDTLHSDELAPIHRDMLRAFYSVLKSGDAYLKFVLLTGITKFGQLSIFSGLNNIQDISLRREYAGICGITESEFLDIFKSSVKECANEWGCSEEDAFLELKKNYDGYHFSPQSPDIYNPWSLLNALSERDIRQYWNASGGNASFLHKLIIGQKMQLSDLSGYECYADDLYGSNADITNPIAVLYQAGYLTIKNYSINSRLYTLDYPNKEVADGFIKGMLESYSNTSEMNTSLSIRKFRPLPTKMLI